MSTMSSKWSFLFLGMIWILAVHCSLVNSQCQRPKDFFQVLETDPAGTQILSLPATGSADWRYEFSDRRYNPIRNYLNFVKDQDKYTMTLLKPLDLEELRDEYKIEESAYTIMMYCSEPAKGEVTYNIIVSSKPVNEYAPQFNTSSIDVYVPETSESVTVINLIDWASDKDQNTLSREINGFYFVPPLSPLLGMRAFMGSVYTLSGLDYESLPKDKKYLKVGVQVRDTGGKDGTATLTIHVLDADDLPPKFTYTGCPEPCDYILYTAEFNANATGKLTGIEPAPIQAKDGDDLGSAVTYKMTQGPESYSDYVSMDPVTAEVIILKPLIGLQTSQIVIIFEAQENTLAKRTKSTSLLISVLSGTPPIIPLQSRESSDDNVVIVGAVLGVIVFIIIIILIVAMIYCRTRYRKVIHPQTNDDPMTYRQYTDDKTKMEAKTVSEESPRPAILSDEEMKVDEEITTWLPANHLADIVDLSDEDTLKTKKRNGVAPNSTKMNSRDSAFEESSDKKSGSEDSQKDPDPDFDPVTEYAEVGMHNECSNGKKYESLGKSSDHVYVPDPTAEQQTSKDVHNINDSGVEEAEYLTPSSTRVKLQNQAAAYNKSNKSSATDPDTSVYSDLISIDGDLNEFKNNSQIVNGISSGAAAHVKTLEGKAIASSSPKPESHKSKKLGKVSKSRQSLSDDADDDEMTEYSIPRSEKSNVEIDKHTRRFTEEEVLSPSFNNTDPDDDNRPEVPPRPKIREVSGLKVKDQNRRNGDEVHYASVQKKALRKHKKEPSEKDDSLDGQNNQDDSKEDVGNKIDPPMRRKRHRKRSRQVKAPEEDIYDGTKDYEDLEMDPEFYLDTKKTRIKRSSRVPAIQIDPDDTQYWITVTNDY